MVEVDANQPLKDFIILKGPGGVLHEQAIEYEFRPFKCSHCHKFGHMPSRCPHLTRGRADWIRRNQGQPQPGTQIPVPPATQLQAGNTNLVSEHAGIPGERIQSSPCISTTLHISRTESSPGNIGEHSSENVVIAGPVVSSREHVSSGSPPVMNGCILQLIEAQHRTVSGSVAAVASPMQNVALFWFTGNGECATKCY